MLRTLSLAALAVISSSVCTQTIFTVPQGFSSKEGSSGIHLPLRYTPARIQFGYDAKATGWKGPRIIKELWARADSSRYLTTGFTIDCEVLISSNGCDPATWSNNFAKNHGGDKRVFMKRVSMSFKPFTAAPSPAPFSIRLKGDSPFVAVKPTLVIDWKTYSKTNETHPNFYIDAHRLSGTSSGRSGYTTPIGKPCNPNNFYSYAMGYNEGQRFKPFCYTRYVGDHVLHWIGSKEIKMPIAGQPGCTLYTTPIAFHPVIAKTTNTSSLLFSWGRVPKGMKGASVICQFAAIDKTFTSMRWSRATKAVFGDYKVTYPYTISHRYNYGSGTRTFDPDKDNANSGSAGRAAVFQIK